MIEPTLDPDVQVVGREIGPPPVVVYERISTGERWRVIGACNQCGLCVVGTAEPERYVWDGPVGTPLSVRDLQYGTRLDEPFALGFEADFVELAKQIPTATVTGCSMTSESA